MHADRPPRPDSPSIVLCLSALLSTAVSTTPVTAQTTASPQPRGAATAEATVPGSPADRLYALFDREWERTMRENPEWASQLGDRRWNDRWQDLSPEAIAASHAADRTALEELLAIERDALPPDARLDYDLFHQELERAIEGYRFRMFEIPLNQRGGVQTADEIQESLRFTEVADYEDWIGRLSRIGTLVDRTTALMERGIAAGRVPPRVIMERIPDQIAKQVVDDPEASPFWKAFEEMPEEIPAAERERLRREGREAIAEVVLPAYRRFQRFFADRYLPATRATVGAWDLPEGEAFYRFATRAFTTTDLTPEEIHEIGLAEVTRIRAEMDVLAREAGFASREAFIEDLRTNPRHYVAEPEELMRRVARVTKQIDGELPRFFGLLPRLPYGIREIPAEIAEGTTTAYYNPGSAESGIAGTYYVNTSKLDQRPLWEVPALSLHEAVPGHHLQIALQQELDLAPFRRHFTGFTAFTEGWGLYAESLGGEMGLYDTPPRRMGELSYQMWRAARLVVDTGIHAFGWDKARAIAFMRDNTALTEANIEAEVNRYISWPGQALGYMIGRLKILELRARAEAALGERFDVRRFHDAVLRNGSVPLDVLEAEIDAWIAAEQAGAGQNP